MVASRYFLMFRIERVAQAVADEVQREHRQADGGDGEEHLIRLRWSACRWRRWPANPNEAIGF